MLCFRVVNLIEERLQSSQEALSIQSAFDEDFRQMTSHVQQCHAQLQQLARGIGAEESAAAQNLDACQQLKADIDQCRPQLDSLRQSSEKLQVRGLTSSSEEFLQLTGDYTELTEHVMQHERTLHGALQLRKNFVENKTGVTQQLQLLQEELATVEASSDAAEIKVESLNVSLIYGNSAHV